MAGARTSFPRTQRRAALAPYLLASAAAHLLLLAAAGRLPAARAPAPPGPIQVRLAEESRPAPRARAGAPEARGRDARDVAPPRPVPAKASPPPPVPARAGPPEAEVLAKPPPPPRATRKAPPRIAREAPASPPPPPRIARTPPAARPEAERAADRPMAEQTVRAPGRAASSPPKAPAPEARAPRLARAPAPSPPRAAEALRPEDLRARLRDILGRIERAKRYPEAARRMGVEGTAVVAFRLGPDGGLRELRLRRSSGHRLLDDASLEAVRRAAPLPYVPQALILPIRYNLRDPEP